MRVYDEITSPRISRLSAALLVEVGNSAFGGYKFALIYRDNGVGHIFTNIGGNATAETHASIPGADVGELFGEIKAAGTISGVAASTIDDGDCVFVRFKEGGSWSEFAVYRIKGDRFI